MKTTLLLSLTLALTLSSCSQKKSQTAGSSTSFKGRIVLGAFNDNVSYPTLDESQLKGLPRVVNFSSEGTKAKDQSDRGTCTFFSTAAMIESAIKKDLKKEVNISEEYLNYKTKAMGYFPRSEGSNVEENIYAVQSGGILLERDWAYQPSWFTPGLPCEAYKATDSYAPAKCFSHNRPDAEVSRKIIPSNGIKFSELPKNTTNIIKFLAKNKRALTLSVTVNFNGWPDTGDVFHNEELRQECLSNPSDCGGHSILLTGYDLDKRVFFFKNSWGEKWGQKGFGTITFDTVDNYVTNSLYYATATNEFDLPEDYEKDYFTYEDFQATATLNNANISVSATGSVKNAQSRLVYVSSFIMKKTKNEEAANDTNTKSVSVNGAPLKAVAYFMPTLDGIVKWDEEAPLVLNYNQNVLNEPMLANILSSSTEEVYLRTTLYVHTDDSSYKVLKRYYQPLR